MAPLHQNEPSTKTAASPSSKEGSVPSGFILKLYQMVNGAPDDIITVRHLTSAFVLRNISLALQFIPGKQ
eukprot:CAMPEP_0178911260 /NCGR_PEP_ID=MMETSP0786-20121207/9591_1 /TAXON_ID=186022 /ORGANISM="Thalassionema frauenfeldii, Strain CCMP 1798" /LENGTH=69 /DNA_ID=CAMNT_0020583677 /DNA_START=27 /DNA_END=236 /DNA_ORIENTATION=+